MRRERRGRPAEQGRLGPRRGRDRAPAGQGALALRRGAVARRQVAGLGRQRLPADGDEGRGRRRTRGRPRRSAATSATYAWSPDGRWLAYEKELDERLPVDLHLRHAGGAGPPGHRRAGPPTSARPGIRTAATCGSPPTVPPTRCWATIDLQNVETKNEKIYALLLRPDVKSPLLQDAGLPPAADKDAKKDDGKKDKKTDEKDEKKDEAPAPIEIDFDGLADRVVELPVDRGSYSVAGATSTQVFYVSQPLQGMAEGPDFFEEAPPAASLMVWSLEDKEATLFVAGISAVRPGGQGRQDRHHDRSRGRSRGGHGGAPGRGHGQGQGGPGRRRGRAGAPRRMGAGLLRGLAPDARLLLGRGHGRPGLGRHRQALRHAAGPGVQPRRPQRPDRPGLRRGQHQPHLRVRR